MSVERFPVEAGHILMFARSIGDPNPIYADEEYAAGTEVGGIVAPPTFAQASAQFDPDYVLRPKIGQPWFGSGREATGLRAGVAAGSAARIRAARAAMACGLHAEQHFEYHRHIGPGDVLSATTRAGERVGEGRSVRQARVLRDHHRVPRPERRARHHRHAASASAPSVRSRRKEDE